MKKRRNILLVTAVCVASLFVGAVAADVISEIKAELRRDFTIIVDGEKQNFKNVNGEKVYPILFEGTTYLPLRAIGELMGKTVYWYEDDKRIELKDEGSTVTDADVIISDSKKDEAKNKDNKNKNAEKNELKDVDKSAFVGEEKAKEIALKKAGLAEADVVFERTELDLDNGIWQYEVEFRNGRTEYEADIKALDGTILEWKVDVD